jgi:hypothetical protein
MLVLKIVGAVLALAVGIWLGLPGRYSQSTQDLERTMDSGLGRTRKVKRHFTPFAWMQRKAPARSRRPQARRGFRLESPDEDA